jgi:hypothetical protein
MQPSMRDALTQAYRPWPFESRGLWLEDEEPAEVEELERLKKKQKNLENELAAKRKRQREQGEHPAVPDQL